MNDLNCFKKKICDNDLDIYNKTILYLNQQLLKKNITEEKFIIFFDVLVENGFYQKVKVDVNNIKLYREKENFKVYKYALISYIKIKNEKKLVDKIDLLNSIKKFPNIKEISDIIDNKKEIYNYKKYLCGFKYKYIKRKIDGENEINFLLATTDKKYDNQKEEIIGRLRQIVKKLGLKFLVNMNIEIKTSIDVIDHNLERIYIYYNKIINNLSNFFEDIENIINYYTEIINIYTKMRTNKNILINVSKYEHELANEKK